MNEQEINEIFAQQIQSINSEIDTPTKDTNNNNIILIKTLSLIKWKPELLSELKPKHKVFLQNQLKNYKNYDFNTFVQGTENYGPLAYARSELIDLSYYYNQNNIEYTKGIIKKIKNGETLSESESVVTRQISQLYATLDAFGSDELIDIKQDVEICLSFLKSENQSKTIDSITTMAELFKAQGTSKSNQHTFALTILSLFKLQPELFSHFETKNKEFVKQLRKHCLSLEFNNFLSSITVTGHDDYTCARNELIDLYNYYNDGKITSTKTLIGKIKNGEALTDNEIDDALRIRNLNTILTPFDSENLIDIKDDIEACLSFTTPKEKQLALNSILDLQQEFNHPKTILQRKHKIALTTLSSLKSQPELCLQLETEHKKFLIELLVHCRTWNFKDFLKTNVNEHSASECARNELMYLNNYYPSFSTNLIQKINNGETLTIDEFEETKKICNLNTFLSTIFPHDQRDKFNEFDEDDNFKTLLEELTTQAKTCSQSDLQNPIQTIFEERESTDPTQTIFTNCETSFIKLLSTITYNDVGKKHLTQEHKDFLAMELKNCLGNTSLNKRMSQGYNNYQSIHDKEFLYVSDGLRRLTYKSRKLDQVTSIISKLNKLSSSISESEREQNKLSLSEFGIVYDLKDTYHILKKYIDIIDNPNLTQELTTILAQTKQCMKFVEKMGQLYQRDFQAPSGTIKLDNIRKEAAIKGSQLSWINIIIEKCITKYGHASVVSKTTPNEDESDYMVSNIYLRDVNKNKGGYVQHKFNLREFLYSEQYHIQPEKLISDNNLFLLKKGYGANWKKYLHDKLRNIEREIHDSSLSNQKFTKLSVSIDKQDAMATEVVFTAGGAHKQFTQNNFEQIHAQVMGSHYDQGEEHTMICSEFVAHTTIASLFKLNNQLQTDLGVELDVLKIPFGKHENIANISPERLLTILKQANCVQQYVLPEINRYIATEPTTTTTFISDHSLKEIQILKELAIAHIETLEINDLTNEHEKLKELEEMFPSMTHPFPPNKSLDYYFALDFGNKESFASFQAKPPQEKQAEFEAWCSNTKTEVNDQIITRKEDLQQKEIHIEEQRQQIIKIQNQPLHDLPGLFELCKQALKDNQEGQRLTQSLKQKMDLETHSKNITEIIATREQEDIENRQNKCHAAWQWLISCVGFDNRSQTNRIKKLQSKHLRTYDEIIQKQESSHELYGSDIEIEKRGSISHLELLSSDADQIIQKIHQISAKETNIKEFTLADHAYGLALDEYLKSKDCLLSRADKKRIRNSPDFSKMNSLHQTKTLYQDIIKQMQINPDHIITETLEIIRSSQESYLQNPYIQSLLITEPNRDGLQHNKLQNARIKIRSSIIKTMSSEIKTIKSKIEMINKQERNFTKEERLEIQRTINYKEMLNILSSHISEDDKGKMQEDITFIEEKLKSDQKSHEQFFQRKPH